MQEKEAQLIVKAILAGISRKHAVTDIKPENQLREFGIDAPRSNKFKERLLVTLSGTNKPDSTTSLTALRITPTSTVKAVAEEVAKAYKRSLAEGVSSEFEDTGTSGVGIVVCTSLAQHSPKYSVAQIRPEMKLNELGLNLAGLVKAKTSIYRSFSGTRPRIKLEDYIRNPRVSRAPTVGDLVDASIEAFSLSGDDTGTQRG